jgi:PTH1 family peptidyl-tRNA hydrolase
MKLIVGLGNPGRKYEQTRHNVGFVAASKLASLVGASPSKVRFEGEFAEAELGEKLCILWPQTYMNASGKSVRRACDFYKISTEDILVICDDLNLPTGRIRIRASGSAGGQKGLADIIRHLQTDTFARLRVGIDRPPTGWEAADYVLGKFSKNEKDKIETATTDAAKAAIDWATQGVRFTMNRYNSDPSSKQAAQNTKAKTRDQEKTADREPDDGSGPDRRNRPQST